MMSPLGYLDIDDVISMSDECMLASVAHDFGRTREGASALLSGGCRRRCPRVADARYQRAVAKRLPRGGCTQRRWVISCFVHVVGFDYQEFK